MPIVLSYRFDPIRDRRTRHVRNRGERNKYSLKRKNVTQENSITYAAATLVNVPPGVNGHVRMSAYTEDWFHLAIYDQGFDQFHVEIA